MAEAAWLQRVVCCRHGNVARAWQAEDTINVAVIGAGFLGARIITEMLLLGNNVAPSPARW